MKNKNYLLVFALLAIVLLSGCADAVSIKDCLNTEPVGFWYGLWHGMIAVIAFIVSLFDNDVAVYAVYNNGGWYNFGFLLGVGAFAGTGTRACSR